MKLDKARLQIIYRNSILLALICGMLFAGVVYIVVSELFNSTWASLMMIVSFVFMASYSYKKSLFILTERYIKELEQREVT